LWLGYSLLAVASLMTLTALLSLVLGDIGHAAIFGSTTLGVSLFAVILVYTTRLMSAKESFSEALTFLVLFWLVIPVFVAIPFYASGVVPNALTAYFEGVSAITTTGASTLEPDILPKPLHIWRSLCQWAGGVVVAIFAVVILAALNLRGTGVHRSVLFTFRKGELFQHLASVVKVVAGIYLAISAVCFVLLVFAGTPLFDAFCLSLTSVSTGGLTPRNEPLDFYVSGIGVFALCISCILGAFNVSILWDIFRNRTWNELRRLITNVEHRALWFLFGFLVIIGALYTDLHHMATIVPEARDLTIM